MNQKIYEKLMQLNKKAYAKYSNFSVACLLELENNELFNGVNIENFSYGATICAERSAIINAYLNSKNNNLKIKTFYLITNTDKIYFPCGLCLQMIKEFVHNDCNFVIYNNLNQFKTFKFTQLFPFSKVIQFAHVKKD